MMQIAALLRQVNEQLRGAGFQENEARSVASLLLAEAAGCRPVELLLHGTQELDPRPIAAQVARVLAGEPLQYVLGHSGFMGLTLTTRPGVLIPRFDSECLVEAGAELLQDLPAPRIADLCTGSGALALGLLSLVPQARADATDISPEALALAAENARRCGMEQRLELFSGDLAQPLLEQGRSYDLVICNPPYIPSGDIDDLPLPVRQEPRLALDGGLDGLDFYRRLAQQAPGLLLPGGLLVVEQGDGQAEAVEEILCAGGFFPRGPVFDLAGRRRGLILRCVRSQIPGAAHAAPAEGPSGGCYEDLRGQPDDPWEGAPLPQAVPAEAAPAETVPWWGEAPPAPDSGPDSDPWEF